MADIGIGIVGSGFMGLTYSEVVANHVTGAKLVALAGGSRAENLAGDYSVAVESTAEDLIGRGDVDAVVLATPDQFRCELTLQAAAAGKHVLAEKPMAPTVAECDQMIAACEKAGVNLAVVKTERYRVLTQKAKQIVDDGDIGPIRMMRTISSFPSELTRELFDTRAWMADPKSGGLFFGMASHNADFFRWICGSEVKQVYAQCHTYSDVEAPALSVMAQLAFENDVMAQMWISAELPSPGFPSSEVRFQIVGRDGMLDFDNFDFLDVAKGGEPWERAFTPEKFDYLKEPKSPIRLEPHRGVIQEFIDSIQEQRPPQVDGREGRAAVEICQACLISAQQAAAVSLPL